ncbi:MAG TPA: lipocalin-like domain-containing protein [Vicinamibacteria bacterium]|nr:lipocalin-like domain-containing protein [Vicinamibacteria bacterium]
MRALPVVAALVGLALLCPTAPYAQAQTTLKLAPAEPLAFARATSPRAFRLPEDHGPHFEFQTEWWYYTGQLATADERRFGFQLTFFRRGLSPGPPPVAGLATNQIYFAHFALTDVGAGRHASAERLSRGAAGLAGASGQPFRVFVEDWTAVATSPDGASVRVQARNGGLVLDLELRATKALVAHGDRGLSPKSDAPGNASHYVGYTRMSARGRVGTDGTGTPVTGEAWFDHEWSTSALGPLALGWDWFSLQLGEGRELMLFEIRRADGSWEGASGGTLVAQDGRTRRLRSADFEITVLERWRSPHTRADYPARWRLRVPSEGLELDVQPLLSDQEMRTSFVYWEGAVSVIGTSRGRPLTGRGYVELTGYARSMQGVF